ncbi:MAG: glycosyltransferase [Pseudolysinimonas sp.]
MTEPRQALVVSMSPLATDPRILREIDWLASDGWIVDTLGIGPTPDERVRRHFPTGRAPAWTEPRVAKGLIHTLLPYRARFRLLMEPQLPADLRDSTGAYDLIVVNDVDLVPWIARRGRSLLAAGGRVHLDLHEWHPSEPGRAPDLTTRLIRGYQDWKTDQLASPVFTTRSTVAAGLGDLYVERYGVPPLRIIRNSPAYEALQPTPVDPDAIDLVYHGNADLARGLGLLAVALPLLEPRFRLNLMLTGSDADKQALRALLAENSHRVVFHDPVPVAQIARRINAWDLEIIFYPPTIPNLKYSLPNKFFEAIEGRLGVVAGESPEMASLIREYGIGTVVDGWRGEDLAAAINQLTAEQIVAIKAGTEAATRVLNSQTERLVFEQLLTGER